MDQGEAEARAILRVDARANPIEIKRAYRRLARELHPDHAPQDPASQARAADAMAVVNEAWTTITRLIAAGTLGRSSSATPGTQEDEDGLWALKLRTVGPDECESCGAMPAAAFRIIGVRTRIFGWSTQRHRGIFCRTCSITMCRDAGYMTLTRGFWGLPAVFAPFVLVHISANWLKTRKLAQTRFRMGDVITTRRIPAFSKRPLHRRPTAYLVPVLIATLWGSLLWINTGLYSKLQDTGSLSLFEMALDPSLQPGDCLRLAIPNGLTQTDCTDAKAAYGLSAIVGDAIECPSDTFAVLAIEQKQSQGEPSKLGCLRMNA